MDNSFGSVHNLREFARERRYLEHIHQYPHWDGHHYRPHSSPSSGMIIHHLERSRMSSYDDRNAEDDRFDPVEEEQKHSMTPRNRLQYQSTRDGDILVVGGSYDGGEGDDRAPGAETTFSGGEARSSPKRRGHSRNLSEHFYDATKLTSEHAPVDSANDFGQYRDDPLYPLPGQASGQKHRRGTSGDAANPPEAHRRINSIGNSATVHRRPYIQERQHQRVDSAGLDILTAAVDASREELASAAGGRAAREHWEHVRSGSRRSPIEMAPYDHNPGAPPSHSPRGHPHGYAGGPPPPPYYASHGYPPTAYPPPSYYGPPPNAGYPRTVPCAPVGGYPVQYARGPDPYAKPSTQGPLHQPGLERPREEPPPGKDLSADKGEMTAPPPGHPSHWRSGGGPTPTVPIYVSSNQQSGDYGQSAMDSHHHPKAPSVSSWAPPMPAFIGGAPGDYPDHPLKGHHRATSSSVSFLGLDVGGLDNTDATFLKNLQASTGAPVPAFGLTNFPAKQDRQHSDQESTDDDGKSKLALGGTSKRVRRKCNITGCPNRVVQGGLCISHGAKRKQCKHPGCNKNVKKAGLCSTHGPARKRCEYEGCGKVAVQGGRCIAHGAKKKLCCMDGCTKQAILAGMCKKHHDQTRKHTDGSVPPPGDLAQCKEIEVKPDTTKSEKGPRKPTHTRGLSLFQEMSPEIVGNILGEDVDAAGPPAPGQHRHQSTFSRDFSSLY